VNISQLNLRSEKFDDDGDGDDDDDDYNNNNNNPLRVNPFHLLLTKFNVGCEKLVDMLFSLLFSIFK
jgi:hypothetical protein